MNIFKKRKFIENHRISIQTIIENLIEHNFNINKVLKSYPTLTKEEIINALRKI